jgi:hypothetical protein
VGSTCAYFYIKNSLIRGFYLRAVSTPQKLPSAGTAYGAGEPKVGEISGVTFIAS